MKNYTAMFIIRPTLSEDGYKAVVNEITKIFTDREGKVLEVNEWGMKDMAYEIEDFKKGYYVVLKVEANPDAVAEYNRVCNIREDIIRHIIVKD
ncbi:MAG TPA: 30S ribosomal protein S6 [Acholeplasmataceae bacterium]|jgi:small subunit ribosomal protein S6|nr:30S ribosomal protein S6 [Acholeplasmataceae bacterium]